MLKRHIRSLLPFLLFSFAMPLAAEHQIDLEPRQPTATTPTRLVLQGQDPCCGVETRAFDRLEVDGRTVRVYSRAALGGILGPPSPPYLFSVDAGLLDPGAWTVEHVSLDLDGENPAVLVERDVTVGDGLLVRVVPARPTNVEPVALEVTGVGSCPSLGPVEIVGREVRTTWSPGGCLGPPVVETLTTEPFGPILAGQRRAVVRQGIGSEVASLPFEVVPDPTLLHGGRFRVQVFWEDQESQSGEGRLVQFPSRESALYWFFSPENFEIAVKVLDGCAINGHYWVFASGSTNVGVDLFVQDLEKSRLETWSSPLGTPFETLTEIEAFPCD